MLMRESPWGVMEGAESAGERSLLTCLWRPRANIFIFSRFMYSFTIESLVGLRCRAEGTMFLPGPSESLSCFISLTPFLSEFPPLPPRATQVLVSLGKVLCADRLQKWSDVTYLILLHGVGWTQCIALPGVLHSEAGTSHGTAHCPRDGHLSSHCCK